MTDDARLQARYRRLTANAALPPSDDLAQVLGGGGFPDEEGTPLDRVAASALQADLLRTALALAQDAQALSRDVAQLRAPRRAVIVRRCLAAAAALGAVAVLVSGLRQQPELPSGPSLAPGDVILSASFESAPPPIDGERPIFAASFDS